MGFEAFSCDLQDCSGNYPEWHLKMDFFEAIKLHKWNLIIIHPPCTFTSLCGNRWYHDSTKRLEGIELCKKSWEVSCSVCDYVILEQPKTIMQKYIGNKTQVIQPHYFGDPETKETWIWLKGLPKLNYTSVLKKPDNGWRNNDKNNQFRLVDENGKVVGWNDKRIAKLRSKTYPGIAQAIATQYGSFLLNGY